MSLHVAAWNSLAAGPGRVQLILVSAYSHSHSCLWDYRDEQCASDDDDDDDQSRRCLVAAMRAMAREDIIILAKQRMICLKK